MSDYITTYSGTHFDPTNPEPEKIQVTDIAHALSLICRGNGHVKTFFSVGQHCINCALEAEARGYSNRLILASLLHDASECYMSDVPRPFKKTLPEYQKQEKHLLDVIYRWFLGSALSDEEQTALKQIDDDLLFYDLKELLNESSDGEAPELHIPLSYEVQPFEAVERKYLQLYYLYQGNTSCDLLLRKIKVTSNHAIRQQIQFILNCYRKAAELGHPDAVRCLNQLEVKFSRFLSGK
ncbi:MAG: hypothetical protein ACI4EG_15420 [Fusicatenibacter sp.]